MVQVACRDVRLARPPPRLECALALRRVRLTAGFDGVRLLQRHWRSTATALGSVASLCASASLLYDEGGEPVTNAPEPTGYP